MTTASPGVIIDGAVPRTPKERVACVLDYTDLLAEESDFAVGALAIRMLELTKNQLDNCDDPEDEIWPELEDELIGFINQVLPDELICTVGEVNPGDVIVREVGHPEDETELM